jgi:octaprenyl-diphosphate synthase
VQFFAARKKAFTAEKAAASVFKSIEREIELVEAELERQARSNIQVIDYLGNYLLETKGKRVRPALLILAAKALAARADEQGIIRLAAVMELLHTATLVHDDIIDNSDVRRNRPSLNARFGNQASVLMGDWLYMSAFETSLQQRSLEILDILTRLTRMMTEGELMQMSLIGNVRITEDQYFDVLKRKTAFLFSGCCEIGAILGGAGEEQQAALRDYGMNLGIAFQLADDILDFTADAGTLGKPAGNDLLEGKVTLPLVKLTQADPRSAEMLEDIMDAGKYSNGTQKEILRMLSRHGLLDWTQKIALEYAEMARINLEVLPQTEYRSALDAIPDFVVRRSK